MRNRSPSSSLQLSFELGSLAPETAEAACLACGAAAVTYCDAGNSPVLEPAPGEFRLWPSTRLNAWFADPDSAPGLVRALSSTLNIPESSIHCELLADRAWEREWLRDFHAMRFGEHLWICPSHERVTEPLAAVVRLDPGLAFGTGTHPSTALCLEFLDAHAHAFRAATRVIDFGCGSGILALAALALGAGSAECFDIDPQALLATSENAAANGFGERLRIVTRADTLQPGADVLLANILAGPLCALAPRFAALVKPGGHLVLAGLMTEQAAEVTQAYAAWFDIQPFRDRDSWVALHGRRH